VVVGTETVLGVGWLGGGGRLRGCLLGGSQLKGCRLGGCWLSGGWLVDCRLGDCWLPEAPIVGSEWVGS
jgi:hypothetical protein